MLLAVIELSVTDEQADRQILDLNKTLKSMKQQGLLRRKAEQLKELAESVRANH